MATNTFQIRGQVVDSKSGRGIPGLRVEALFGKTTTDAKGNFQLEFTAEHFTEISADKLPEVSFNIFENNTLLKSTDRDVVLTTKEGQQELLITLDYHTQGKPEKDIPIHVDLLKIKTGDALHLSAESQKYIDTKLNTFLTEHIINSFRRPSEELKAAIRTLNLDYHYIKDTDLQTVIKEQVLPVLKQDLSLKEELATTDSEGFAGKTTKIEELLHLEQPIKDNPIFAIETKRIKLLELADIAKIDAITTGRLADKDFGLEHASDAVWETLVKEGILSETQRKDLQLTVELANLTGNNFPLIKTLKTDKLTSTKDFITLDKDDWLEILRTHAGEMPEGETLEEYAENITFNIEHTYPTSYFMFRIAVKDKQETLNLVHNIQPLFANNPILFEHGAVASINWDGIEGRETVEKSLTRLNGLANTYTYLGVADILNDANTNPAEKQDRIAQEIGKLNRFYQNNPDIDLRFVNFFEKSANADSNTPAGLIWDNIAADDRPKVRKQLMAYQRVMNLSAGFDASEALLAKGLDSALAITTLTEGQFIKTSGLPEQTAAGVYINALHADTQTVHMAESVRDAVWGDFKDIRISNLSPTLVNELKDIAGYEELFGSQNYCDCEHCRSIFSPAAYFVDLMHFIETYVPNKIFDDNPALYLKNRRPDLWNLQLTCENTNTLIPYLEIVNDVLEQYLNNVTLGSRNIYDTLSTAENSFRLPFHLPLEELRIYLYHFGLTLSDIFKVLKQDDLAIAREQLQLSEEEVNAVVTPDTGGVRYRYGNPASIGQMDVQEFLKCTGITREELDQLVTLKFIKGNGTIIITKESLPGEIQQYVEKVKNLSKSKLDRIHRFIRLWRELPWTLQELDLVLSTLKAANLANTLNQSAVIHIATLVEVQERLNVSVEELCALFHSIPIRPVKIGKPALFERMFEPEELFGDENRVKFHHASFNTNDPNDEEVDANTPRLLAGLGISETELLHSLQFLHTKMDIDDNGDFMLNHEKLSLLYRHAKLAKALKLSIEDFLHAIELALEPPADFISTIDHIQPLITFVEWLNTTPFSIAELWFILWGEESSTANYQISTKQITALVENIQKDYAFFSSKLLAEIEGVSESDSEAIINQMHTDGLVAISSDGEHFRLTPAYDLSQDFTAVLDAIGASPELREKVDEIREHLNRYVILPTVLPPYLVNFFNITQEHFEALRPFIETDLTNSAFIIALNTTITDGVADTPADLDILVTLIREMERLQLLFEKLHVETASLQFIASHTDIFKISDIQHLILKDIEFLTIYKHLLELQEESESIIHQLLSNYQTHTEFTSNEAALLTELLEHDMSLIQSLLNSLELSTNPLEALRHLMECLEICATLGINGFSLRQLTATNFDELQKARDTVYGAFKSKYDDETKWKETIEPFEERLNMKKRDALCEYILAIPELAFEDANELYNSFLLDVEMSGCAKTSKVKAGISSLQLYIHRCLMNLEQTEDFNIRNKIQIPEADWKEFTDEWEWRKNYRVWEANRKVFLYPENYIEPELRDNKTPIFRELEDELLQQKITKEAAENAYKTYITQFAKVAKLKISGSYYHKDTKETKNTDILYLFGRTAVDPPEYYYRKYIAYKEWTPWQKIELSINAPHVSAIIHNGKLYLFWVEVNTQEKSGVENGNSVPQGYDHTINLQYSYLNESGKWIPPQRLKFTMFHTDQEKIEHFFLSASFFDALVVEVFPNTDISALGMLKDKPFYTIDELWSAVEGLIGMELTDQQKKRIFKHIDVKRFYTDSDKKEIEAWKGYKKSYPATENNKILINHIISRFKSKKLDLYNNRLVDTSLFGQIIPRGLCPVILYQADNINILLLTVPFSYGINEADFDDGLTVRDKRNVILELTNSFPGGEADPHKITIVHNKPGDYIVQLGEQQFLIHYNDGPMILMYDLHPSSYSCFYSYQIIATRIKRVLIRLSTSLPDDLGKILYTEGLDAFLSLETQKNSTEHSLVSEGITFLNPSELMPLPDNPEHIDFKGAYGLYYRELFFHIPFLIANHLNANQKFKEAKYWYEKIFNPTASETPEPEKPTDRNWRYIEFRNLNIKKLKEILTDETAIEEYKRDPFNPHAIARLRLNAYQKAIVMKYIDNLLDWGDHLFAQDTFESINEATMLYTLAADILGKRPVRLGKCETTPAGQMTYTQIGPALEKGSEFLMTLENWGISNFTEMFRDKIKHVGLPTMPTMEFGAGDMSENAVFNTVFNTSRKTLDVAPYEDVVDAKRLIKHLEFDGTTGDGKKKLPTPPAMSQVRQSALAFCVPANTTLLGYWDRVGDRLFKIRHCMNIKGIRRQLALFQPPINPMMLVRAKAAGLSLEDILSSFTGALPPYRFTYLIEKTKSLAGTVQNFGSALLSALEKKDTQELTLLRSVHEQNILKMTTEIKKKQIEETLANLENLKMIKVNVENRKKHYDNLISTGLIEWEKTQQIAKHTAIGLQAVDAGIRAYGAISYLLPEIGSPFAFKYGGKQIGDNATAWAELIKNLARMAESISASAGLEATFQRREEEWKHQQTLVNQELLQIGQKIIAAEARLAITEKDFEIHKTTKEQTEEVYNFYKDKFTNLGLYNYLATSLTRLYREAYNLAYDMAKLAERAYQFERDDETIFIENDNWQADKAGLLAGERLLLQLQRMEKAYIERNVREYEINQSFSMAQINPEALIELRETGTSTFTIPEIVFDVFYPGQYKRIIKSVRLTIPCVTGPYTNVSCKLSLERSQIRKEPKTGADFLLDVPEQRLTSVATSNANNDAGVFELNFRDERYMPFEGAGAISSWKLELPGTFRQFDYDTISDVIFHISYTAKDDGSFRGSVETAMQQSLIDYASTYGLFRLFSTKHEFSNEFHRLLHPVGDEQTTTLDILQHHFPYMLREQVLEGKLQLKSATVFLQPKEGKTIDTNGLTLSIKGVNASSWTIAFPKNEADAEEKDKIKKAMVSLSGDPVGAWEINAGVDGLDKELVEDILLLLHYTIKVETP